MLLFSFQHAVHVGGQRADDVLGLLCGHGPVARLGVPGFTGTSIARTFFIAAAMFGATSLYGYTTKRDLTQFGSFLIMGLIGVVIASIVNIFLGSSALQFAISVIGIVVFIGLTAWDTQTIKEQYAENFDAESQPEARRLRRFLALSELRQHLPAAAEFHRRARRVDALRTKRSSGSARIAKTVMPSRIVHPARGGPASQRPADAMLTPRCSSTSGQDDQPGAPYYMAQTILVQEQALEAAQDRINEVERQLADRGFLSPAASAATSRLRRGATACVPLTSRATSRCVERLPAVAASLPAPCRSR